MNKSKKKPQKLTKNSIKRMKQKKENEIFANMEAFLNILIKKPISKGMGSKILKTSKQLNKLGTKSIQNFKKVSVKENSKIVDDLEKLLNKLEKRNSKLSNIYDKTLSQFNQHMNKLQKTLNKNNFNPKSI